MSDRKIFALMVITLVLSCLIMRKSIAQGLPDPSSWVTNELTLQNNSFDWNNSPYNWNNTYLNPYAKNGVYDNEGNRIGYERKNEYGTTNIFDNDGNRRGYKK